MEYAFRHLEKQINHNRGRNLFFRSGGNPLGFVKDTFSVVERLKCMDADAEKRLIDHAVRLALEEFYRINQYYAFDASARMQLRCIYSKLFTELKLLQKEDELDNLEKIHSQNVTDWLVKTNPFSEQVYSGSCKIVDVVACAEYSAPLQLELLHIDLLSISEPILDVGCGRYGKLVLFLRECGLEAYGIDRIEPEPDFCQHADWFEYDFGVRKWGTIVSNLGFSNQFVHHHLRSDGDYMQYAKRYVAILESLRVGGKFHYAPSLSFIESYLDAKTFLRKEFSLSEEYQSAIIERVK